MIRTVIKKCVRAVAAGALASISLLALYDVIDIYARPIWFVAFLTCAWLVWDTDE